MRTNKLLSLLLCRLLLILWAAWSSAYAATIQELREQVAAKQAEWTKAKNSLSLMEGFQANYSARSQRLASDRTQLDAVRERIATIQRNNLVKVTLQLGVETAKTMKDACDIGEAATVGVRALAQELLSNTLKDEAKKAMGLDTETLTTPMTVKITGLNALANKKVPEIEAVKKILASDLHTIRGNEWNDRVADPDYDMTKPGNDPRYWSDNAAILVKLENVKAALDVAKQALKDISDKLDEVHQDTDGRMSDAQAEELKLRNELAFLQFALNDAINAEISAARDAAAQAKLNELPDPVAQPPPYVAPKTEEETPDQFQARRVQTIINTVNANVSPLIAQIDAKMAEYNTLLGQYGALASVSDISTFTNVNHLGWLQIFASVVGSSGDRDLSEFPTPSLVASEHVNLKSNIAEVNRRSGAIGAARSLLNQMETIWQSANELRVDVSEWVSMASAQGVSVSFPNYDAPIQGTDVEGFLKSLDDLVDAIPDNLSAGQLRLGELSARYNELITALLSEVSAAGSRFQQAEVSLAQFFAAAAATDQFLLQSGWSQSYDVMPGEAEGTSGYSFWGSGGHVYRTFTRRAFWLRPFTGELLVALKQPGEQGIIAFQQVLNRYGAFLSGFTTANDQYHAKYVALRQALDEINGDGFAGLPPALSVLQDARSVASDLVPPSSIPFAGSDLGSESGLIDIGDRISDLNNSIANHWGLGSTPWLEDPSLDIPGFPFDTHNPASQLLAIKGRSLREIPTWTKLYYSEWKSKRDAWKAELSNWHALFFLYNPFNRLYGMDADWRTQFLTPAETQVQADADVLLARCTPLFDPPTIYEMTPEQTTTKLFPGFGDKVEMHAYSASMGISFQWYRSLNDGPFLPIAGATGAWYDASYAEGVQKFYCRIWNNTGSVISDTRTILGLRRPIMVKQPTPATLAARTGTTVVLTCALDDTPAGGTKNSQWMKAKLDASGKPIIIHSPWGDLLYDSESLITNPRVSGIQSTTLTITNFQPEDAGAYFVHVSNEYSFCQSNVARITHVNTDVAPTFLRHPSSREALPGGSVAFDVAVNGSPSPTFQWKRNGVALSNGPGVTGATTSMLSLDNVQTALSGSITCTVTCGTKSGTSNAAALVVQSPSAPQIVTAPKSVTANPGTVVSFTVLANGGFPTSYAYQWQFKSGDTWNDVSGGTARTLSLMNIAIANVGSYRCVVTNGSTGDNLRSVTSPEAKLTLNGRPIIATQPQDVSARYGASVNFSATATGTPTPTLQWYRIVDGSKALAIAGQTSSTLLLRLSGEPWASGSSFQVFLRATNAAGSADSNLAAITLLDPFDKAASVGRYVGTVGASASLNANLGGFIDLTVTKAGSLTGKLAMAGRTLSFTSECDASGQAEITLPRAGLPSLVARLTFDGEGALTGQLWQVGDHLPQDLVTAHQVSWSSYKNPATAFAGFYTLGLVPPSSATATDPQGTGYLAFRITTEGLCTGSGLLADTTAVVFSSVVWPDGSLPIFDALYGNEGSLLGSPQLATTPAGGTLRWLKKVHTPQVGRVYASGIGPLNLDITGGRYTPPASRHFLLDLTPTQVAGLSLDADHGGLSAPVHLPFTLSMSHVAAFALSTSDYAPTLTFQPTTGTFSGSFDVLDTSIIGGRSITTRRTAMINGVLLSKSGTEPAAILGSFMLPGRLPTVTTSPILSGSVEVIIP